MIDSDRNEVRMIVVMALMNGQWGEGACDQADRIIDALTQAGWLP